MTLAEAHGRRAADAALRLAARPGAPQRALRRPSRHRAGARGRAASWSACLERALAEPELLEHLRDAHPPRAPSRRDRSASSTPCSSAAGCARDRRARSRLGAAAWIGWAWLPHLLTPACVWRGPRGEPPPRADLRRRPRPGVDAARARRARATAGVRATFFLVGERARARARRRAPHGRRGPRGRQPLVVAPQPLALRAARDGERDRPRPRAAGRAARARRPATSGRRGAW